MLGRWNNAIYDRIVPETTETSIGIDEIRNFSVALQLSPRGSDYSVGVIDRGELLTVAAQQALLKTLEEPPIRSRIIIAVSHSSLLLPTVLSRCEIVELQSSVPYTEAELTECANQLAKIEGLSIGARIAWCTNLGKTREELSRFITLAVYTLRKNNRTHTKLLHDLLNASRYTATNVNLLMVIERIFLYN